MRKPTNTRPLQIIFILFFFSLVTSHILFTISSINSSTKTEPLEEASKNIAVPISGAVHLPGLYSIQEGMRYSEIIKSLNLQKYANIKKIHLNRCIKGSKKFIVPKFKLIEVTIRKNGKDVQCYVPYGMEVNQLNKWVKINSEERVIWASRRRKIRENEVIVIETQVSAKDW